MRDNAKLFARYMDDIIRTIKSHLIERKLKEINSLHPALKFTIEKEVDGEIAFLDMKIIRSNSLLSSTWYSKPTDTGLTMNYHALAPKKYKRSVVIGFVYRIYRACSNWKNFHTSLESAKKILEHNQYPPAFYNPIIKHTLDRISLKSSCENQPTVSDESKSTSDKMFFIQYRGKLTEHYEQSLKKCNAPVKMIMTLTKLKTVLPSLKPSVDKAFKSGVVYQILCPHCNMCYVGQTSRHLQTRFKEHLRPGSPVFQHLRKCKASTDFKQLVKILSAGSKSYDHLLTMEALYIDEVKPSLNTKDEYRSRTLSIKIK